MRIIWRGNSSNSITFYYVSENVKRQWYHMQIVEEYCGLSALGECLQRKCCSEFWFCSWSGGSGSALATVCSYLRNIQFISWTLFNMLMFYEKMCRTNKDKDNCTPFWFTRLTYLQTVIVKFEREIILSKHLPKSTCSEGAKVLPKLGADSLPSHSSSVAVVEKRSQPVSKFWSRIGKRKEQVSTRASFCSRQLVFYVSYGILFSIAWVFSDAETFGKATRMWKSNQW